MPSQSVEEYIEAIFRLSSDGDTASTGELAELLKVAAPSVTTMLRRLVRDGLVIHERYRGVYLTEAGKELAQSLLRRHRLSERLLTDVLGVPWEQAHDHACRLEHALNGELADRVAEVLGDPRTCPHGNPVEGAAEPGLVRLSDLCVGDCAVIARLADEGGEILQHMADAGLKPGVCVKLHSVSPVGDAFAVEADGRISPVGLTAARMIWVRK
jgi:DtxR family transcriptional regulator, Mn-dependent transcriptional regulator